MFLRFFFCEVRALTDFKYNNLNVDSHGKRIVSRSNHTRPDHILAAARVRDPFAARGKDDQTSYREIARALKHSGVILDLPELNETDQPTLPRIVTKKPRRGFSHPAGKHELVSVLQFFGERCFYGLRLIKLVQGDTLLSQGVVCMGRLEVPGTIILFDQPPSPWFINGTIPSLERKRLERAGASIEATGDGVQCLIRWSDTDLQNFMLFEVFMHEIGHHLIQQYKGKRNARVVRTKEHELFADSFAQHCRETYLAAKGNLDAQ